MRLCRWILECQREQFGGVVNQATRKLGLPVCTSQENGWPWSAFVRGLRSRLLPLTLLASTIWRRSKWWLTVLFPAPVGPITLRIWSAVCWYQRHDKRTRWWYRSWLFERVSFLVLQCLCEIQFRVLDSCQFKVLTVIFTDLVWI